MLSHGVQFAKYGTQTTFYFALEDATVVDAPFTGVAPLAADIFLSKDGGAPATATNAMTAIGNGIYSWVATATELQCTRLAVSVYDQTATEIFKPIFAVIQTKLQLGQIDVDATQIGGNTHGMVLQGVGTGAGMSVTAGATGVGGIVATGGATSGHGIVGIAPTVGAGILGTGASSAGTSWGGIGGTCPVDGGAGGMGIFGSGIGSGDGARFTGGTTGDGIQTHGGATSGHGINAQGIAGNSQGINASGSGTGNGINASGGATGNGIKGQGGATSGHGIEAATQAGNSSGISASGRGTGQGLSVSHATDNSLMTNIFDNLEGTEPSGAIANNATFKQIFQYLKRRFTNLVTQTATVQTWFKDDSVTTLTTEACSNDGTTQSKGKSA